MIWDAGTPRIRRSSNCGNRRRDIALEPLRQFILIVDDLLPAEDLLILFLGHQVISKPRFVCLPVNRRIRVLLRIVEFVREEPVVLIDAV